MRSVGFRKGGKYREAKDYKVQTLCACVPQYLGWRYLGQLCDLILVKLAEIALLIFLIIAMNHSMMIFSSTTVTLLAKLKRNHLFNIYMVMNDI